jgi:hypothetical protein
MGLAFKFFGYIVIINTAPAIRHVVNGGSKNKILKDEGNNRMPDSGGTVGLF